MLLIVERLKKEQYIFNKIFTNGLSFSTFKIEWISQASSEQRTGRAGRTGPGYCYRLYSNGLFAKMDKFTDPQILSCPLDQTILYLKVNLNNIVNRNKRYI